MSRAFALRKALTIDQIAAAGALHATLKQWRTTDLALSDLHHAMPGFGPAETLLKVVAVNALYGTNVFALVRAARHVQAVINATDLTTAGPQLVGSLAAIPTIADAPPRRYISFASKFAHFFVDPDRFPIYDSYAERTLLLHLGQLAMRDAARPYEAFTRNIAVLTRENELTCGYRELDRYLWVAGVHRAYERGVRALNAELRNLFEHPSLEQRHLLSVLQGRERS